MKLLPQRDFAHCSPIFGSQSQRPLKSQTSTFRFYCKTNWMHNFSYLLNIVLHVSDGLPVHHQESKTVHTASDICHKGSLNAC
jgi:hypothetical protein